MIPVGLRPIMLSPRTSVSRLVPPMIARFAPSWLTETSVSGTTTVRPSEKGSGCETLAPSVIRTVRLPCETATVWICTSRPMTTVPVRSSITTRAGPSASV